MLEESRGNTHRDQCCLRDRAHIPAGIHQRGQQGVLQNRRPFLTRRKKSVFPHFHDHLVEERCEREVSVPAGEVVSVEEVDNRGEEEGSMGVVELAGKRGKERGKEREETAGSGLGGSEGSRRGRREMGPEGAASVEEGESGREVEER